MKIIVLKFGGTSIGSIQRIKKVSKIIKSYSKKYRVIVLSSAMSGTTNKLINMSKQISENFPDNEYDTLVSAGEQISCSLLAGHLVTNGLNSKSWMAWQIPILTEGKHKYSRIKYINKTKIYKFRNIFNMFNYFHVKNYIKFFFIIKILRRFIMIFNF